MTEPLCPGLADADSTDSVNETEKNTHKIINYFKKEPTVAFTCISAAVVVLSFLANMAIYLRQSAFLRYWNIDTVYAVRSSPNQFYRVCGNIIYAVSVMVAISIINGSYEAYLPAKQLILSLRAMTKPQEIKVKATNKKGKKAVNKARKFRRKYPEARKELHARTIREVDKGNQYLMERMKETQTLSREIVKELRMAMLAHLIVAGFILLFGLTFYALFGAGNSSAFWPYPVLVIFLLGAMYLLCVFLHRKEIDREAIKKDAETCVDIYLKELQNDKHEYPLLRKWHDRLSDSAIRSILISSVIYITMSLISFSLIGSSEAKGKNEFPIIHFEDQTYAIVYNNGESVILEECSINDTTIEICTSKQKIISTDGIAYEIIEFDNVSINVHNATLDE